MVEGYAKVTVKGIEESIPLTPLEIARIVYQSLGFDVDAEPTGVNGRWKVTATAFDGLASVSKTGTMHHAVAELIESIK